MGAERVTQAEFGVMVGISQQAVSDLVSRGVLSPDGLAAEWLLAYCSRLREQAAGRSSSGGLDLAQERAALAREQRASYAIKNAVALGEYAPISLLSDVLSFASQAVVDRLEALTAQIKRAAPGMDEATRRVIDQTIANCRNEWVRSTADLTAARLAELAGDVDDGDAASGVSAP